MTTSIINSHNQPLKVEASDLKLQDIVKSLPKECFKISPFKAWVEVIISVLMVSLGYFTLAVAPLYILPLGWVFTGTALTGFFVIGHDCGHRSFSKSIWVNDLVGYIMFMPLVYPFHPWRICHNHHHKHTNKLDEDNAWHPIRPYVFERWSKPEQWSYKTLLLNRLWWLASIGHWAVTHFDWRKFRKQNQRDVKLSVAVVVLFAATTFPAIISTMGIWGWVKFWFIPWLVYHFWMSTFTYIHHTSPDIPFKTSDKWNQVLAQLNGTIHCNYPRWVEFLCHNINVHVPHHVSTAIPSYNLRLAYISLQEKWGGYIRPECNFSWTLIKQLTDTCHIYKTDFGYQSFDEYYAEKGGNSQAPN